MAGSVVAFKDLVEKMKGKDGCIDDFDVLVSYNARLLNDLLSKNTTQFDGVKSFSGSADYLDPNSGKTAQVHFDCTLAAPLLQFVGSENVTLSFDLGGKYGTSNVAIPPHVKVVISATLIAVHGKIVGNKEDSKFEADPQSTTAKAQTVAVFDTAGTYTADTFPGIGVCLDFSEATVEIKPVTAGEVEVGQTAFIDTLVSKTIKGIFAAQTSRKLYLAAIKANAATTPVNHAEVLKPQAFCFSVVPGDTGADSTLCIWVTVENGIHKYTGGEKKVLSFSPDNKALNPIPSGSTASIIFRYELIMEHLIKSGLANSNTTAITDASSKTDGGMSLTYKYPNKAVFVKGNVWRTQYGSQNMDNVDFHMDDAAATMKFPYTIGANPTTSWASNNMRLYWHYTTAGNGYGGGTDEDGHVNIKYHLDITGAWTATDDEIDITWPMPKKFTQIDMKAESPGFWQYVCGGREAVPDLYANANPDVPGITLSFNPLNYFFTTNLILPGQHIFKADTPSTGLAVPRDLILTGKTKELPPKPKDNGHALFANFNASFVQPGLSTTSTGLDETGKKSAADFISDLTDPSTGLFGGLLAAAADKDQTESKSLETLESKGYGSVDLEEYLSLLNIKESDLFSSAGPPVVTVMYAGADTTPADSTTATESDAVGDADPATPATTVPFDLRAYAGIYSVDGSPTQQLVVNPQSGNITIDGIESKPTISLDNQQRSVVTWTAGSKTYAITFTSSVVNGQFTGSYSGTYQTVGAAAGSTGTSISGTQQIPTDVNERVLSDYSSDVLAITGFVFGTGAGILGIIGFIVALCWRKRDNKTGKGTKKERIEMKDLLDKQSTVLIHDKTQVDIGFDFMAERSAKKAMKKLNWESLGDSIQETVHTAVKTKLDHLTLEQLTQMKKDSNNAHWKDLVTDADKATGEAVKSYVTDNVQSKILNDLLAFKSTGLKDDAQLTDGVDKVLESHISSKTKELNENKPRGDPITFVETALKLLVTDRLLKAQAKEIAHLNTVNAGIDKGVKARDANILIEEGKLETAKAAESAIDPQKDPTGHDAKKKAREAIEKTLETMHDQNKNETETYNANHQKKTNMENSETSEKLEKTKLELEAKKRRGETLGKPHH